MDIRLNNLNKTIVNCKKCPRLVKFVHKVSTQKRKQNMNEVYWGKPVPGFGNLNSKIAIIGLGYVGLPLANAFSKKFKVIGYDNNLKKVKELKNGIDKTNQFDIQKLKSFLNRVKLTNSFEEISGCNVYIVTVPTPVTNLKKPDLSYLLDATKMVGTVLKHGDIIIYESTV